MNKILQLLPELELDEALFLDVFLKDISEEQMKHFAMIYRTRRRDPQIILLTAIIGLFGVAGVHRFLIGHMGMGILYFFTAGLCFIGTLVDVINYKSLALENNQRVAREVMVFL
jgi:TM2 domain-containing membrane protein YozV